MRLGGIINQELGDFKHIFNHRYFYDGNDLTRSSTPFVFLILEVWNIFIFYLTIILEMTLIIFVNYIFIRLI